MLSDGALARPSFVIQCPPLLFKNSGDFVPVSGDRRQLELAIGYARAARAGLLPLSRHRLPEPAGKNLGVRAIPEEFRGALVLT